MIFLEKLCAWIGSDSMVCKTINLSFGTQQRTVDSYCVKYAKFIQKNIHFGFAVFLKRCSRFWLPERKKKTFVYLTQTTGFPFNK